MRFSLALALVALTAAAIAAPPTAKIVGPTGGQPGDILVLDASHSEGAEHFAWEVTPKLPQEGRPTILPLGDAGTKCIVTSVPGTYTVFLAASNDEGVRIIEWPMRVGNPQPDPEPDPGPDPQPTPDPGRFGLAADALSWSSSVTGETRGTEATAMAAAFAAVAAEIAAGATTQPDAILQSLARQCATAIPSSDRQGAWAVFSSQFERRMAALYHEGKLATPDDWAVAFREIAAGLAAAR